MIEILATCSDLPYKSRKNCSRSTPVIGCVKKCTSAWSLQTESSTAPRDHQGLRWSTTGPDLAVVMTNQLLQPSHHEKRQSNSDVPQSMTTHRLLTFGVYCSSVKPSKKDIDDRWKLDIWRSYGSKECRPPSLEENKHIQLTIHHRYIYIFIAHCVAKLATCKTTY